MPKPITAIRDEYIQLRMADELDDVDSSLSTLHYRSNRIAEIEEEYPRDVKDWERIVERNLSKATNFSSGAPYPRPVLEDKRCHSRTR